MRAVRCLWVGYDQTALRSVVGFHIADIPLFLPDRETSRPRLRHHFGSRLAGPTSLCNPLVREILRQPCDTAPDASARTSLRPPLRRSPAMANGGAPPLSQPASRPCEGLAPGDHSRTQLTMARLQCLNAPLYSRGPSAARDPCSPATCQHQKLCRRHSQTFYGTAACARRPRARDL